ncbi:calcium permeable stress-gated cation channel [Entomortierella parvispora]|uniref:Calcium permeable stress-gated cation channel n=1 Tax=Entomortierella parvispora TaxID=205924 RepID=A0A9P3LY51_9FUNG|nr:calcium permeable stress-gated cation channel [Entomortierella parvispora]
MSALVNANVANGATLQVSALAINLGTNVGLSLLTLGAFCWLRPRNGVIYARKFKSSPADKRAPRLEEGYFSWMKPVWSCPDEELVDKIGLDAVVFIRFVRMCRQVFVIMAVIGCGALIPINIISTTRSQVEDQPPPDKISLLTMAGVVDFDWLWAHVAATWMFSLVLIFAMLHGYRSFLKFRIQYFESTSYQENMASRTLMLAGLPASLQGDDKLTAFMSNLGMKDIPVQAMVGRKVDMLPELMKKHKEMVKALEKVMVKYFADPAHPPAKRPTVRLGRFFGPKVDAIDYYSQQIESLSDQIERTRVEINKSAPTNYGFVSYPTIQAAHRTAKELSNPIVLRSRSKMIDPPDIFLSPVPKDIIWFNASNPKQLRKSRKIIVNTLFVIGSLLFFIPMGLLSTVAKLDSIIGLFPSSQDWLLAHPFASGMLQSLFPVLVMDVLMLLVRKLITYLAWLQGNITRSSTDRSTLAKFYLFFTMNNLIFFALSSIILSFFAQVKLILSTVTFSSSSWQAILTFLRGQNDIVLVLSQKVIDSSLFWVNYISLRNFSALLDLSQIVSLVLYWAKKSVTPRDKNKMDKPAVFDFPLFLSSQMFLLTAALLYSVIAPLVLFFAAVYFSLASLVYKYQLMYVFRTKVETGGRLFRVIYNRVFVALILFQIVMIGVVNLKLAHLQSLALIPLPIFTLLFKIFLARTYDPKIDYYDYGSARNEKHLYKPHSSGKNKGNTLSMNFEDPIFHAKMIAALVPEGAKKMLSSKILNGDNFSDEGKKKKGLKSRSSTSLKGFGFGRTSTNNSKQELIEMRSVSRASTRKSYESSARAQSPVDDYYDDRDQKQSLTKAAAYQYDESYRPKGQDMNSFVAGRYSLDKKADPFTYSRKSSDNGSGRTSRQSGQQQQQQQQQQPSYLELARMHQTESYRTTGKAQQYEESNALKYVPKMSRSKPQQLPPQSQLNEVLVYNDKQEYEETNVTDLVSEPAPTLPKTRSARMPRPAPAAHTSTTSATSASSRRRAHEKAPVLQHSNSSPNLTTDYSTPAGELQSHFQRSGTRPSSSRHKISRSQTTAGDIGMGTQDQNDTSYNTTATTASQSGRMGTQDQNDTSYAPTTTSRSQSRRRGTQDQNDTSYAPTTAGSSQSRRRGSQDQNDTSYAPTTAGSSQSRRRGSQDQNDTSYGTAAPTSQSRRGNRSNRSAAANNI